MNKVACLLFICSCAIIVSCLPWDYDWEKLLGNDPILMKFNNKSQEDTVTFFLYNQDNQSYPFMLSNITVEPNDNKVLRGEYKDIIRKIKHIGILAFHHSPVLESMSLGEFKEGQDTLFIDSLFCTYEQLIFLEWEVYYPFRITQLKLNASRNE